MENPSTQTPHYTFLSRKLPIILLFILFELIIITCSVIVGFNISQKQNINFQTQVIIPSITQPSVTSTPTSFPIAKVSDASITPAWVTYKNDLFDFSFKYPAKFSLSDNLQQTSDPQDWSVKKSLNLSHPQNNCGLTILINPDGFGPWFPHKFLHVIYEDNKGLVVNREEINTKNINPWTYQLIVISQSTSSPITDKVYDLYISASCPDNGLINRKYLDELVKNILSTFKFN